MADPVTDQPTDPGHDPSNPPPIGKSEENGLPAPVRILLKFIMYFGLAAVVFWAAMSLLLNYYLKDGFEGHLSGMFQQPTRILGGVTLGTDLAKPSIVISGIDVGKSPLLPQSIHIEIGRFEAGMPWQVVKEGTEGLLSFFMKIENVKADGKEYGSYEIPVTAMPEGDYVVKGLQGHLKDAALTGNFTKKGNQLSADATATGLDYSQVVEGATGGSVKIDFNLAATTGADMAALLPAVGGKFTLIGGAGSMSGMSLGLWSGNAVKSAIEGTKINCVMGDFSIDKGVAKPSVLIMDTEDATIYGEGYIDFTRQYADMVFIPRPKQPQTVNLAMPLNIYGPFTALTTTPDAATVSAKLAAMEHGLPDAAMKALPAAAAGDNACVTYAKGAGAP